jgi:hypothetical protein
VRRIGLKNCPYCGSSEVFPSQSKTLLERVSVAFLLCLVRCHSCMRHHYRPLLLQIPKHPAMQAIPKKPVSAGSEREKKENRSA